MVKSDLVNILAEKHPHLYKKHIEKVVQAVLEEITLALCRGGRVEIRGFGAFSVKNRNSRAARNPLTGASVHVQEKYIPVYKSGKDIRDRLNSGE